MNKLFSGDLMRDYDVISMQRTQLLDKVAKLHTRHRVLDIAKDHAEQRRYAQEFNAVVIEYSLVLVDYLDMYQHTLAEFTYRQYLQIPEDIQVELTRLQADLVVTMH